MTQGSDVLAANHLGQHWPAPSRARLMAVLARNELRGYLRNRLAIFWVFIFPLLLYVTLGFAIGTDLGAVTVRVFDADDSPASRAFVSQVRADLLAHSVFRAVVETGPGASRSRRELKLTVPAGFGAALETRGADGPVRMEYDSSRSAALYLASKSIERTALAYSLSLNPGAPEITVVRAPQEPAAPPLAYEQFLFSGVLVLMLLSGGVLSLAFTLAGQREQNVLKLPAVWPLPPNLFLLAVMLTRVLVMLMASVVFLAIGHLLFGVELHLDPVRAIAAASILALGGVLFLSIGFLVAARSTGVAGAEVLGNALYYPMLLLGDLTIPLREMPFHFDDVLRWLPTSKVVAGLRGVMFSDGPVVWPWSLYGYMLLVTALCVLVGMRTFRFLPEASA